MEIVNNARKNRFEIDLGDGVAIAEYIVRNRTIIFTHTEVPEKSEGTGVGVRLASGALDYAREHGLRVVPLCPFIKAYIDRHSEYRDLVDG